MQLTKITAKKQLTDEQAENLIGKFLNESHYDTLVTSDCDVYGTDGKLLLKFRKNIIPLEVIKNGYESFKNSIELTEGRGMASGSSHKRIRQDGSVSNITVGNKVNSGNVGFMDSGAMVRYCRKTAFAKRYFNEFKQGIPFVEFVDGLYNDLCPNHYRLQKAIAIGTDINYLIGESCFTTVTVNRNFITAAHKDSGDFTDGFGNLCVYREGYYEGGYFCLPQYRIAVDMHNTDMLFVDVHKVHGNTPFKNESEDYLRIAFVMYYREYMYKCSSPTEELHKTKMEQTGFFKL